MPSTNAINAGSQIRGMDIEHVASALELTALYVPVDSVLLPGTELYSLYPIPPQSLLRSKIRRYAKMEMEM